MLYFSALIPHDEVVAQLAADTVYSGASLGVGGNRFSSGTVSNLATLLLKVNIPDRPITVHYYNVIIPCNQMHK